MPIYEFQCGCGNNSEVHLSIAEMGRQQNCNICGDVLQRIISLPLPAIFVLTGRDMALASLNQKGGASPATRYGDKAMSERLSADGLEKPPKTLW